MDAGVSKITRKAKNMENYMNDGGAPSELLFGDILTSTILVALLRGMSERHVFDQLEWAQAHAFAEFYAIKQREEAGH